MGKSYHGLDKLSLNNLIMDSTMMKDYLTYTLMNEFGVTSSLCSYVYISVNGEDWGLYLAVEGVEEAFLERNYGSNYGELYKPDSTNLGGGGGRGDIEMGDIDMGEFDMGEFTPPDDETIPDISSLPDDGIDLGDIDFGGFGGKGGFDNNGGFDMGSSDVKLQYIDDDPDSYSNIFDNAKTDIDSSDEERLINSLESLSNYENIEEIVDVDEVIRYFVVHNYVCNGDSYTGTMVHNYYLYEKDGQLAMIPWDYNLAFGTFQGGSAQSTVNTPIDSPVDNGSGEDRPMWYWIVEDPEYTELYHEYYREFLESVDIGSIINRAYALIAKYVASDPTAFYSYDEFEIGVEALRAFCELRSESIAAQLETGSTTETMDYADASGLNLSDMGTMNSGGNRGDMTGGMRGDMNEAMSGGMRGDWTQNTTENTDGNSAPTSIITTGDINSNPPDLPDGSDMGDIPDGIDMTNPPDGFDMTTPPDGFDMTTPPDGFGTVDSTDTSNSAPDAVIDSDEQDALVSSPESDSSSADTNTDGTVDSNTDIADPGTDSSSDSSYAQSARPNQGGMNFPGAQNGNLSTQSEMSSSSSNSTIWVWLGISAVILGAGLIIAKLYRY